MKRIILGLSVLIGLGLFAFTAYRVWNYDPVVITLADSIYNGCIAEHTVDICMLGYNQMFFVVMMHNIMYFFLSLAIPFFTIIGASVFKKSTT